MKETFGDRAHAVATAEDRPDRAAPGRRVAAVLPLRRAWLVVRPLLILVALLQLAPLLWLIGERSLDVPYGDEWATVGLVQRATSGTLRPFHFWRFHNEHRIPIPRAISLILVALTRYDRQVAMVFNLAVAACTALLLLATARRASGPRGVTLPLAVPLSLLLFSPTQFEN